MTRQIQTDLPTVEPTPRPALGPNDVRLSDGRVATLRETTGADDQRVERLMSELGYSFQGMGAMGYARCCALASIKKIAGEDMVPPMTTAELESRLQVFKTKDVTRLITKYTEVNGLTEDAAGTFPG